MKNKEEYLQALQNELRALPAEEQDSAMEYYTDYFNDAGEEHFQEVVEELGSPEKLGSYIRTKFTCVPATQKQNEDKHEDKQHASNKSSFNSQTPEKQASGLNILLVIVLLLLTFPVWGPILLSFLGIVFGLFISFIALGFAGIIGAIALLGAGISLCIASFVAFFTEPLTSILSLGCGIFILGLGILAAVAGIWLCIKLVPRIIRLIVKVCQMPFNKNKKGGQA